MISTDTFIELALLLPKSNGQPHFEKTSFCVGNKIFATLDIKSEIACLKLSPADQVIFSGIGRSAIYPVPNKWGLLGWTYVELKKVRKNTILDALTMAYAGAVNKK
jgi:hypothetical protein